ncbi:DUF1361 domain-containing protein [Weissella hellenica]|uniref:DUF1361 domain-containing protein n=1 Tax=Weissella hellenica TaxID=46256 RepID=A0A7X6RDF1_WEIHE|nr:DUF1361 domain-containing protein [Weissella hellenica]NKY67455.1 DUF1361 domain-containing protein [Weissella hellenica]SCC06629.1 Uncharacterized membrane protein [Weissella hellenica]
MKKDILRVHLVVLSLLLVIWLVPTNYNFLIWNLFLALVPFDLALIIRYLSGKKGQLLLKLGLTVVWLAFFPNAMYMVTDFSHLSSIGTGLMTETQFFNYAILAVGVLMGLLFGLSSAHIIGRVYGGVLSSTWTVVLSFVSAYGIYLGRFLRINSWELISAPHKVLTLFLTSLSSHSLVFVISFGSLQFALLVLYHMMRRINTD